MVGLDLDDGYVAAVEVTGGSVTRAVSMDVAPGLVVDGEVVDPSRLADALRGFFKQHRLPKRVRVGVANQQIAVRSFSIPRIDGDAERNAAVRFQAQDAIAMPLDEAVLDYQVVGETTTPEGSAHLRVVAVAARETMVNRFVEALRGAGLRPDSVDLDAFALVRALAPAMSSATTPVADGGASQPTAPQGARVYTHLAGITNLAVCRRRHLPLCPPARDHARRGRGGRAGGARRSDAPIRTGACEGADRLGWPCRSASRPPGSRTGPASWRCSRGSPRGSS